jgi:hypothetical protein
MSTTVSTRRRATGIATVIALLAALLSAFAVTGPAQAGAAGYTGTPSGGAWPDATLAIMTVGESYTDSVTSPDNADTRYGAVGTHGDVPPGITIAGDATNLALVHVTGTPTQAGTFEFGIDIPGESTTSLDFVVEVESNGAATTTVLTSPEASPYSAMDLTATVTGAAAGGTVTFSIGSDDIGTGILDGAGVATFTGDIDPSYAGAPVTVVATYEGVDGVYVASTSDPVDVYIYASTTITGSVTENGAPVNAAVALLNSGGVTVTSGTSTGGSYSLTIDEPTTAAEAQAEYYVSATYGGRTVYYSLAAGVGQPDIDDIDDATATTPGDWFDVSWDLYFTVPPVWTETALATPHRGTAYSDSVSASGADIQYTVSSGTLPAGLSLNPTTGAITGTPTDQLTYTFQLKAHNDYGAVYQSYTITPGDPGVPPTFVDTTIAAPQLGAPFHENVQATGDPTIVYSSGTLPAGLTLDPATGEITGTPTAAGEFSVLITATNEFGHDDYTWEGSVTAAPEIKLVLDFQAGTPITDAGTQISADGLKVGSTYTLDLHSDPIRLYTGIIDASGGFTWLVSLPADTPIGSHELILTGVAPDGTVMTAHAWFTLLANGRIGAVSYSGPLGLAFTGSEPALPIGIAGGLLALGVAAVLLGRGRRTARA